LKMRKAETGCRSDQEVHYSVLGKRAQGAGMGGLGDDFDEDLQEAKYLGKKKGGAWAKEKSPRKEMTPPSRQTRLIREGGEREDLGKTRRHGVRG